MVAATCMSTDAADAAGAVDFDRCAAVTALGDDSACLAIEIADASGEIGGEFETACEYLAGGDVLPSGMETLVVCTGGE